MRTATIPGECFAVWWGACRAGRLSGRWPVPFSAGVCGARDCGPCSHWGVLQLVFIGVFWGGSAVRVYICGT